VEGNVPQGIHQKINKRLHLLPNHPLNFIKRKIEAYLNKSNQTSFSTFDNFNPIVSVTQNFDDLLFPADHVGRSPNDTYYINQDTLLRTHTSAHQSSLFRERVRAFLVTGDVYRRDAIDSVHYPIFHQMEGAKLFSPSVLEESRGTTPRFSSDLPLEIYYADSTYKSHPEVKLVEADLKHTLEGLVKFLFGQVELRWVDAYFPFTSPSWELEIFFNNAWLEVLGCGVIHPTILQRCGLALDRGWAFGLGLERLAMILFDIPDIRLFWTEDKRFHQQFAQLTGAPLYSVDMRPLRFKPYSKYPLCFKDISFWVPEGYHENQFYELVRAIAGDLCESVVLVSTFTHPETNKLSHCYRINYRSMDKNLTNEEVDVMQHEVQKSAAVKLGITIR
jgi:phenylalanyl-tRNA synthetase alpha chain